MTKKLKSEKADLKKELETVNRRMENYKKSIGEYAGKDFGNFLQKIEPEIEKLESRFKEITAQIQGIENQLKSLPTDEEIKEKQKAVTRELTKMEKISQDIKRMHERKWWDSGAVFRQLPFPIKRRLVSIIFGGKDDQGKRYGIYISPMKSRGEFRFEAYGHLGTLQGIFANVPYEGKQPLYGEDNLNAEAMGKQLGETMQAMEGIEEVTKSIISYKESLERR